MLTAAAVVYLPVDEMTRRLDNLEAKIASEQKDSSSPGATGS
jgi:hypothetical protein